MTKKSIKNSFSGNLESENESSEKETNAREFVPKNFATNSVSSAETIKLEEDAAKITLEDEKKYSATKEILPSDLEDTTLVVEKADSIEEENQIFKELAEPKLPRLARENRARLQMQSPTRLNFYWSTKNNPLQTLNRTFGGQSNKYTLVVKLVNQTEKREEIVPVEAEGSTWFDVDADASYRAEIGFYAPNRPFVRIMFSNEVKTPRKNPSPRRDYSPNFDVSANQYAEVLDVSGFRQDAFEVALAGDDEKFAENATQNAFSQFVGNQKSNFTGNDSNDARFALLALASGAMLDNLRGQISKSLFAALQENVENMSAEKALAALKENFGVFSDEITEEEFLAPTVFGASLINFPRGSRKKFVPKFAPVSSLR